jgi:hypothetical protein
MAQLHRFTSVGYFSTIVFLFSNADLPCAGVFMMHAHLNERPFPCAQPYYDIGHYRDTNYRQLRLLPEISEHTAFTKLELPIASFTAIILSFTQVSSCQFRFPSNILGEYWIYREVRGGTLRKIRKMINIRRVPSKSRGHDPQCVRIVQVECKEYRSRDLVG